MYGPSYLGMVQFAAASAVPASGYVTGVGWEIDGGWINCEVPAQRPEGVDQ